MCDIVSEWFQLEKYEHVGMVEPREDTVSNHPRTRGGNIHS